MLNKLMLFCLVTLFAASPSSFAEPARERVNGIGGFFFKSKDPKALAEWYQVHLGVGLTPRAGGERSWTQQAGKTAFQPFPQTSSMLGASVWMLNFRVDHLDRLVKQLQDENIAVTVDPEHYPIGRFAELKDPEGNPIQLWEPQAGK